MNKQDQTAQDLSPHVCGEHNSQILSKINKINVIVITSTVYVVDYIELKAEKCMRNDIRSTDAKSTIHKMACNAVLHNHY